MDSITQFFHVLVFALVAVVFTLAPVAIAYLIAPRTKGTKTHHTYECGIEPFGSAWIRYSSSYYIYALIFIAFDVDVLYLFPAALSYTKGENIYEFYSLLVFILLLALAVVYAWGKGVFTWKRKLSQ
ncbi:MAG: NADH-quinone oxidoreductase subunit A [Smithellaceae bacterium]|nr:NADH-quinone oxidoreductase subunit A [Smithellaceae bacterium]